MEQLDVVFQDKGCLQSYSKATRPVNSNGTVQSSPNGQQSVKLIHLSALANIGPVLTKNSLRNLLLQFEMKMSFLMKTQTIF